MCLFEKGPSSFRSISSSKSLLQTILTHTICCFYFILCFTLQIKELKLENGWIDDGWMTDGGNLLFSLLRNQILLDKEIKYYSPELIGEDNIIFFPLYNNIIQGHQI